MRNTEITYRIMMLKNDIPLTEILSLIKKIGIVITELREADVRDNEGSILYKVDLICCKSDIPTYLNIRDVFRREMQYENFTTIF